METQTMYLDNNATTELLPEVREAILRVVGMRASNASSAHTAGDSARMLLSESRMAVARLIGALPDTIVFTGSGTESNNLVLHSAVAASSDIRCQIVTSPIEHASVLRTCEYLAARGVEIIYLPVDRAGVVSLVAAEKVIAAKTSLVSVQWVNNETGVIQPVEEIGKICRSRQVPLHTDAAQAVGKLAIDIADMPVDFLTITAHKWHGPAGAGAVYVRPSAKLAPLIHGGGQERGIRAGTENLLGVAGMGKAAEVRASRQPGVWRYLQDLRDEFESLILERIQCVRINGKEANRVCNTTNLLFEGVDGQAMVAQLDSKGLFCSQGSACEAQRPEPSHVLRAMGLSEADAYASIRFSFSELNTPEDVRAAVNAVVTVCQQLRHFRLTYRNRPIAASEEK
ncbi:MAG: cysteine desulfurase family protein [Terracidiphilus sp.]